MDKVSFKKIDEHNLLLIGQLSFTSVPTIMADTLQRLNQDDMTIDLAGVTYSDSAGLALLLDWLRHAKAKQQTLRFIHPVPQMKAIAHICGLENILGF